MKFQYSHPRIDCIHSPIVGSACQLGALVEVLANEQRTHCCHRNMRSENVAEHSLMLAVVAPAIAEMHYDQLDVNLIARFATVHDLVEAYVGDTATHDIDAAGLAKKKTREALGLTELSKDFEHMPSFVKFVHDYEQQIIPEARFVRLIDKWLPLVLHIINSGSVLENFTDPEKIISNASTTAARLNSEYPEFRDIIELRMELAKEVSYLMQKHRYTRIK